MRDEIGSAKLALPVALVLVTCFAARFNSCYLFFKGDLFWGVFWLARSNIITMPNKAPISMRNGLAVIGS